jgi:nucleoside-diphosphate-sugar epimerase
MEQLARASAFAGIRRFVLLSSVGIHGGRTDPGDPLTEASPPRPLGAYAFSKREAEDRLRALAVKLKFETVILRPPLVYGPGAPGNFSRLLRWVSAGFPLPFGSVQNRRSFIYVRNLCDALTRAGTDPRAADRVFLVSDGQDLSTPDLIRFLSVFLGKKRCPLFPFPPFLLKGAFLFLGRGELAEKLLDSLEVNSGLIQTTLDWRPPWNVEDGLRDVCAEWLDGTGSEMLSSRRGRLWW